MYSYKKFQKYFRFPMNSIIMYLTLSDIVLVSGFGLIAPIFAVYLTDELPGGTVEVAGIAMMVYLITKSLVQLGIAELVDKIKGERDDFWFMIIGTLAFTIIPILYIFAKSPMHIYVIQFIYGIFSAMTFPSWMALFTRHIDKHREGMEWGIYYTLTDISGAFAAGIGGILASLYGFAVPFIFASVSGLIGGLILLYTYKDLKMK